MWQYDTFDSITFCLNVDISKDSDLTVPMTTTVTMTVTMTVALTVALTVTMMQ